MTVGLRNMNKPRLPDTKFFQFAEDEGWTLVQIRYSRGGGEKSYYVVRNAAELAEIVCKLPPQASVSIMAIGNHLPWIDTVYVATENGECKPGSY